MTEKLACKYCNQECRILTYDKNYKPEAVEWWKCEGCDVSYHQTTSGQLIQQNMFVRNEQKIYCLRVNFVNQRSSLDYRNRPPPYPEWHNIAKFKSALTFSPLELREKLPLILLFS